MHDIGALIPNMAFETLYDLSVFIFMDNTIFDNISENLLKSREIIKMSNVMFEIWASNSYKMILKHV